MIDLEHHPGLASCFLHSIPFLAAAASHWSWDDDDDDGDEEEEEEEKKLMNNSKRHQTSPAAAAAAALSTLLVVIGTFPMGPLENEESRRRRIHIHPIIPDCMTVNPNFHIQNGHSWTWRPERARKRRRRGNQSNCGGRPFYGTTYAFSKIGSTSILSCRGRRRTLRLIDRDPAAVVVA